MSTETDPVEMTRRLVRCASVTPADEGALDEVQRVLEAAGFGCTRVDRGGVPNLFARWGEKAHPRTFGFNGHTDVVPVGDPGDWRDDPFSGVVRDGAIWGRGAADMKSGVAAFATAAADFVTGSPPDGAVILAITGDEEGDAKDGTVALLDWMAREGEAMDVCLVGEPTCPSHMGETMKIGRRGSMTAYITATGLQGHSAYPERALNPVPALARLVDRLDRHVLDEGTAHFDPSTLAVVGFDTGNGANNVIPATCRAMVNIRFNDAHSSTTLSDWLRAEAKGIAEASGIDIDMDIAVAGESFVTPPGRLTDLVADAVEAETGLRPAMSTSGGTSDARFVKDHCAVVEFGLVGQTMHKVDEHVAVDHVVQLKSIYSRILRDYFA